MNTVLFDTFGNKFEFSITNFKKLSTKNNSYFYSCNLETEENEHLFLSNISGYIRSFGDEEIITEISNIDIFFKNHSNPFSFYSYDIRSYINDKGFIDLESKDVNLQYFYKQLNAVKIKNKNLNDYIEEDILYDTGYIVFSDGNVLKIENILNYRNESVDKSDIYSYFIQTREFYYSVCNVECIIMFDNDNGGNLDLVLGFKGNEIIVPKLKRSSINVNFNDQNAIALGDKSFFAVYYYRAISYCYFKENSKGKLIQVDFTPKKDHFLLSI